MIAFIDDHREAYRVEPICKVYVGLREDKPADQVRRER